MAGVAAGVAPFLQRQLKWKGQCAINRAQSTDNTDKYCARRECPGSIAGMNKLSSAGNEQTMAGCLTRNGQTRVRIREAPILTFTIHTA